MIVKTGAVCTENDSWSQCCQNKIRTTKTITKIEMFSWKRMMQVSTNIHNNVGTKGSVYNVNLINTNPNPTLWRKDLSKLSFGYFQTSWLRVWITSSVCVCFNLQIKSLKWISHLLDKEKKCTLCKTSPCIFILCIIVQLIVCIKIK